MRIYGAQIPSKHTNKLKGKWGNLNKEEKYLPTYIFALQVQSHCSYKITITIPLLCNMSHIQHNLHTFSNYWQGVLNIHIHTHAYSIPIHYLISYICAHTYIHSYMFSNFPQLLTSFVSFACKAILYVCCFYLQRIGFTCFMDYSYVLLQNFFGECLQPSVLEKHWSW